MAAIAAKAGAPVHPTSGVVAVVEVDLTTVEGVVDIFQAAVNLNIKKRFFQADEPALLMALCSQETVMLNEEKVFPSNYAKDDFNDSAWYLDNGASNHMTGRREFFSELNENTVGHFTIHHENPIYTEPVGVSPNQSDNQSGHSNASQSGQPGPVLQNDNLGSPTREQQSSMTGPNSPLLNTPLNSNDAWSNSASNSPSSISSSHYDHTPLRGVWTVNDIYSETVPTQQIEFERVLLLHDEEPANFSEAKGSREWQIAMKEELDSIERNGTWSLVKNPPRVKPIGLKWVYKIKKDAKGDVTHYKARLVAKGYVQKHGVDYDEVFAPVTRMETVRLILSLAAQKSWKVHHLDIRTAFSNGELKEQVFVCQPEGYEKPGKEHHVYKLRKALYGLKQAPRSWNSKLDITLQQLGFIKCPREHGAVCMSDLGLLKLNYYLGIQVTQDNKGVSLKQTSYAIKILKEANMWEANSTKFPMEPGLRPAKEDETEPVDPTEYRKLIGRLSRRLQVTCHFRITILISIQICFISQFDAIPSWEAERAAEREFRQTILAWIKSQKNTSSESSFLLPATDEHIVHQEKSEFKSDLLQRFNDFEIPNHYEQSNSLHVSVLDFVVGKEIGDVEVKWHPDSVTSKVEVATIPQSDLIPDYTDVVEDTVRPHSADSKVPLDRCRYWIHYGLLYVDGFSRLGQADSKPNFSFKATDRNIISCADVYSNFPSKLGSLLSGEAGSIQPRDRGARHLLRLDWNGRKKKMTCLRWGNRYGPAHKCPEGEIIGAKHVS
ncbi:hypothetical protein E3N88_17483 [Mikania micrantha]|uniref:Uncharacterized protein n=1 Tax=Mikania micrantha TaxID=192012 RepID=A0A5N6NV19_9ASTR|nr:hypothetical protein E3N88_17483 [Mikania micrantha]